MIARNKTTYAVPTHTWMTLPGTAVQVRHEAGRYTNVTVGVDGALTIEEPEHFWATRLMPPAVPADLGGKADGPCGCGDDDPAGCMFVNAGYPWCRVCTDHHRAPECTVDREGHALWPDGTRQVEP